jgi:hypothetical protein
MCFVHSNMLCRKCLADIGFLMSDKMSSRENIHFNHKFDCIRILRTVEVMEENGTLHTRL